MTIRRPIVNNAGSLEVTQNGDLIDPLVTGLGLTAVATETINAGALVNLWLSGGVIKVRNADNTAEGKEAFGFVTSSYVSTDTVSIYQMGTIGGLSSLTIGSRYYLGTSGGITLTAPTTTGTVVQWVGIAVSSTELLFQLSATPITN